MKSTNNTKLTIDVNFRNICKTEINEHVVLVDSDDFARLSEFKWHVSPSGFTHKTVFRSPLKRLGESKNSKIRIHHEILGHKPPHGFVVDHINGDPLDNRKCNLRICTQAENQHNRRKTTRKTSSQYKGVHLSKRPTKAWGAQIKAEGKIRNLGCFNTELEAAIAYDRAASHYFGGFALVNFPQALIQEYLKFHPLCKGAS